VRRPCRDVGPAIPLVWLRLLTDRDVHIGRPPLRIPILRRLRADRVDNREPGIRPDPTQATRTTAKTLMAVQPLTQGLRRRDLACVPIPHRRRGLNGRTDPGPLGPPATRLRSALRRGQFSPRRSRGAGGNLLCKKELDRWSAIRQPKPKSFTPPQRSHQSSVFIAQEAFAALAVLNNGARHRGEMN
jgi:hypothetical protein